MTAPDLQTDDMTKGALPFTTEGIVELTRRWILPRPPLDVWRDLLATVHDLSDDERGAAVAATTMVQAPGPHLTGFHIANGRRVVAVQGGWWYRGVTSIDPHPDGTLVTYTVVNVARGVGKWAAHFVLARQHRNSLGEAPPFVVDKLG